MPIPAHILLMGGGAAAGGDTTLFTDDFNRSNGNIGATDWNPQHGDPVNIVSNQAKCTVGITPGGFVLWSGSPNNDQYAEVDVVQFQPSSLVGLLLRYNSAQVIDDFYLARCNDAGSDTYEIYKWVNTAFTLLDSQVEAFPSVPFRIRFTAIGTSLKFYVWNGSSWDEKCSATDSAHSSGKAGMLLHDNGTDVIVDNFECGNTS